MITYLIDLRVVREHQFEFSDGFMRPVSHKLTFLKALTLSLHNKLLSWHWLNDNLTGIHSDANCAGD